MKLIVSKSEARDRGLSKFFDGVPCKRGHVEDKYTCNGACCECKRSEMRARYRADPAKFIQKTKEWSAVPANKEKRQVWQRKHKIRNPTAKYNLRRQEREAGRPRPDVCDLCCRPNKNGKPIYFDHCHQSGKFRGWLCHKCNTILGAVADDAIMLRRMADYLDLHKPEQIVRHFQNGGR